MPHLVNVFDTYERRARVYPALLVVLPIALGGASWLPAGVDLVGLAGGALASVVLAAFLGQIARDQGKKRESELFRRWGGKPSALALSFGGGYFDRTTLERVHRKHRELDAGLSLPSSFEEETADPERARAAYESASDLLLSRTRDHERFRLVFEENVNYGYRRNLWAMRSLGLLMASLGVAVSAARIIVIANSGTSVAWSAGSGALAGVLLGLLWLTRVNPSWVRVASDAFARQLVLAAQTI